MLAWGLGAMESPGLPWTRGASGKRVKFAGDSCNFFLVPRSWSPRGRILGDELLSVPAGHDRLPREGGGSLLWTLHNVLLPWAITGTHEPRPNQHWSDVRNLVPDPLYGADPQLRCPMALPSSPNLSAWPGVARALF